MSPTDWRPRLSYLALGIATPLLLWLFGTDWRRLASGGSVMEIPPGVGALARGSPPRAVEEAAGSGPPLPAVYPAAEDLRLDAKDGADGPEISTVHYRFRGIGGAPDRADQLAGGLAAAAAHAEAFRDALGRKIRLTSPVRTLRVVVPGRADLLAAFAASRGVPGAASVYDGATGTVVWRPRADPPDAADLAGLRHELLHQILHLGFLEPLPFVLEEGLAEYAAAAEPDPGSRAGWAWGRIDPVLIGRIRRASAGPPGLFEILDRPPAAFRGPGAPLRYAEAWAAVHFLLHSGAMGRGEVEWRRLWEWAGTEHGGEREWMERGWRSYLRAWEVEVPSSKFQVPRDVEPVRKE